MNRLRVAFGLLLVATFASACLALLSAGLAWHEHVEQQSAQHRLDLVREQRGRTHAETLRRQERAGEVLAFLHAWQPYLEGDHLAKDPATSMRANLELLAQRRLGLVTDQITTPEPRKAGFGTHQVFVQPVSVRASGENLSLLLAWIGESEALYPLARVECCELSGAPSGNLSLQVGFSQPVSKAGLQLMEDSK